MSLFKLLLCSLTLVAHSTLIFALSIAVPSEVQTPGSVTINTYGQPGDPAGERFYSVHVANYSNIANHSISYNLATAPQDSTTVTLTLPQLPQGGPWVIRAQVSGFNSTNFIGTSNGFSVVLPSAGSDFPDGPLPGEVPSNSTLGGLGPTVTPPIQPVTRFSGAAAGGTVVGTLLIVFGIIRLILFCTWRRRRDSRTPSSVEAGQQQKDTGTAPWVAPSASLASVSTADEKGVSPR
ncbi:hypothetical protein DFH09DRAFT_1282780 [Mycena vulgaris]|nr:hypothetical protein DFH09DRAFT_1282780 [Mycena vulgaris]